LNDILQTQIPRIVASHNDQQVVVVSKAKEETDNPFAAPEWQISADKFETYKSEFEILLGDNTTGFLPGAQARPALMASGLSQAVLKKIWSLADHDKDGKLTVNEYAVAKFLIESAHRGDSLPDILPPGLVPPPVKKS